MLVGLDQLGQVERPAPWTISRPMTSWETIRTAASSAEDQQDGLELGVHGRRQSRMGREGRADRALIPTTIDGGRRPRHRPASFIAVGMLHESGSDRERTWTPSGAGSPRPPADRAATLRASPWSPSPSGTPRSRSASSSKPGQLDLGENYPQELWAKAEALADLPVRWHLIGHLQGNKAKKTLPMVRMIHGVDSLKLLRTLDDLAADARRPPERLPPGERLGRGVQARLGARRAPRATPRRSPPAAASRSSA